MLQTSKTNNRKIALYCKVVFLKKSNFLGVHPTLTQKSGFSDCGGTATTFFENLQKVTDSHFQQFNRPLRILADCLVVARAQPPPSFACDPSALQSVAICRRRLGTHGAIIGVLSQPFPVIFLYQTLHPRAPARWCQSPPPNLTILAARSSH